MAEEKTAKTAQTAQPGGLKKNARGKVKNPKKTVLRLMSYLKKFRVHFTIVLICIFLNAFANVRGSLFIQTVIDDYITPMLSTGSKDFSPLLSAVMTMAMIYAVGIISGTICSRTCRLSP